MVECRVAARSTYLSPHRLLQDALLADQTQDLDSHQDLGVLTGDREKG